LIRDFLKNNFFYYFKQHIISDLVNLERFWGGIMDRRVSHKYKGWDKGFKGPKVQGSKVPEA
jgi:hypothetical protein